MPGFIVREYVFYVFLKIKNVTFLRFIEVAFQIERKNVIQKFQDSDC